jgi:hypothetical protein
VAMGPAIQVAAVLSLVTVVLLTGLVWVWVQNYRAFQSGLVAGLLAFAGVLLVENLLALGFFVSMQPLYAGDPRVQAVVALLRGLQLLAVAFLTVVTMR